MNKGLITVDEALQRLKVSKSYLYELLNGGVIVSHLTEEGLGVSLASLENFEKRREADSRELAHYFANSVSLREKAIEDLADMLEDLADTL